MTITLITGANKGLGRETARRLAEAGHTVLLGARDLEQGKRAADEIGAEFVPLDVTDDVSVAAAAEHVRDGPRPVGRPDQQRGHRRAAPPLADVTAAEVLATLDTNLLGVVRLTRAFLPLLRAAANPRIVNVSSGTGRLTWQHESGWPQEKAPPIYSTSKAALTMLTLQYAHALPGSWSTRRSPATPPPALNDHQGTQTVTEGTDVIVRLATLPPGGPTGTAQLREGVTTPW